MSWKLSAQLSFADKLLIEHDALLELDAGLSHEAIFMPPRWKKQQIGAVFRLFVGNLSISFCRFLSQSGKKKLHAIALELDEVNQLLDWKALERHLVGVHNKREGAVAFAPLMMIKALLLQSWYALSDPALEKQLARDLLFRRFVGLGLSDAVPDHSTIWRFRAALEKAGLLDTLHKEINAQLSQRGLLIRQGTVSIIDASVIEAQRARPNKSAKGQSTQDTEAGWNVKAAADGKLKSTFGFKAHVNVDEDGLIKALDFTAGNVHDSKVFADLLGEEDAAVYADSAYASEKHDILLAEKGIDNRILKRAYRNTPLSEAQKAQNRLNSGVRSTVERVFGVLKLHYGMAKARYVGLKRNALRFGLMCVAYNIKRGLSLLQDQMA